MLQPGVINTTFMLLCWMFAGEMDDVLDSIRLLHMYRNICRYFCSMVSKAHVCCPCFFFTRLLLIMLPE